jgi:hypothetical protein
MNIADEPAYIHEMYGTEPGKESFANSWFPKWKAHQE